VRVESIQISILIVNYNTDELTVQAVESVFAYVKDINFEIIVVENNSERTNLKELLTSYKSVKFIQLKENIGFGNANNYGYELSKGKYLFLLNSDAYLIDDSLSGLFNFMEDVANEEVACCGPNLIDGNGNPNLCYGNFLSKDKILLDLGFKKMNAIENKGKLAISKICDFEINTEVDYLSGAAVFIRRSVIEKYGLFNPNYFMYYEDMDLCFKYHSKGFKSILIPSLKIVHIGGQSWTKNEFGTINSLRIILYSKYLFSKNILNGPTAFIFYSLDYVKSLSQYFKSRFRILLKKMQK
jgi:GT2 family glycosyltransferase